MLLLVPEIGLTGQTVDRVRGRFAASRVAVLHSGLSAGERLAAYGALARGEARIAVGARSAVFAPLRDLGLIVVDEEHDTSYKQESEPAYDARTVARWRAEQTGAVVLLGSATPSVESYSARAAARRPAAAGGRLAAAAPGDRRHARRARRVLAGAGAGAHRRGGRRREGHPVPQPARLRLLPRLRPLRPHLAVPALRRHAHAVRRPRPALPHLRPQRAGAGAVPASAAAWSWCVCGFGTERLEREVRLLLPGVELLRLDSDVAGSYARLRHVLRSFAAPGPKVLVGTQMIAKGHHFPEVTLVGVVNADLTLHFPDFRAEERTFAMLVQVGGRSGRGERPAASSCRR